MLSELDQLIARLKRSRSVRSQVALIGTFAPWLRDQLRTIRDDPAPLTFWGATRNFDEHAEQTIVCSQALQAIAELTGQDMPANICHAGLLHSYGYLLSDLETPFGRKRARWVQPTIERGLGLKRPVLRPNPHAGTLLANLTWMHGNIAWRERPRDRNRLATLRGSVAPELLDYPFGDLQIARIVEHVRLPRAGASAGSVRLHTDIVALRPSRTGATPRNALLAYSVSGSALPEPRLQTCFPITTRIARELLDETMSGPTAVIRPRYNTVIAGFDSPRSGRRQITRTA